MLKICYLLSLGVPLLGCTMTVLSLLRLEFVHYLNSRQKCEALVLNPGSSLTSWKLLLETVSDSFQVDLLPLRMMPIQILDPLLPLCSRYPGLQNPLRERPQPTSRTCRGLVLHLLSHLKSKPYHVYCAYPWSQELLKRQPEWLHTDESWCIHKCFTMQKRAGGGKRRSGERSLNGTLWLTLWCHVEVRTQIQHVNLAFWVLMITYSSR